MKYQCEECGKTYLERGRLNKHIRELNISIDFILWVSVFFYWNCSFVLNENRNSSFSISERVHRKQIAVKKNCCRLCDFKCEELNELGRHMKSHTGERSKWFGLPLHL